MFFNFKLFGTTNTQSSLQVCVNDLNAAFDELAPDVNTYKILFLVFGGLIIFLIVTLIILFIISEKPQQAFSNLLKEGVSTPTSKIRNYLVINSIILSVLCLCVAIIGMVFIKNVDNLDKNTNIDKITENNEILKQSLNQLNFNIQNKEFIQNNISELQSDYTLQSAYTKIQNACNQIIEEHKQCMEVGYSYSNTINLNDVSSDVSQVDLDIVDQNYKIIASIFDLILSFIKSINDSASSSSVDCFLKLDQYINNKDNIIKSAKLVNNDIVDLNDVITTIDRIIDSLKLLGYAQNNNFTSLIEFLEGMSGKSNELINKIFINIIHDYNTSVCKINNDGILGIIDIISVIMSFIGPNISTISYVDQKKTFNSTSELISYCYTKNNTLNGLKDSTNALKKVLNNFLVTDVPYDNLKRTLCDVAIFALKSFSSQSEYNIPVTGTKLYEKLLNSINHIQKMKNIYDIILKTWNQNHQTVYGNLMFMVQFSEDMKKYFQSANFNQAILDLIDIFNKIKEMYTYNNLLKTNTVSINEDTCILFLRETQTKYKSLINKMKILNNTVNFGSLYNVFDSIIVKIVSMPMKDSVFLTKNKENIIDYLKEIKEVNAKFYSQLICEIENLLYQSKDFSNQGSWYDGTINSLNFYIEDNFNSVTVPMKFIRVSLDQAELISSFEAKVKDQDYIKLMIHDTPTGYLIIPSMKVSELFSKFSTQMKNIHQSMLSLLSKLKQNNQITQYLLNNYTTILSTFESGCKTIPSLRLFYYMVLFSSHAGENIGILKKELNMFSDIKLILDNIPTTLLDPDISNIN